MMQKFCIFVKVLILLCFNVFDPIRDASAQTCGTVTSCICVTGTTCPTNPNNTGIGIDPRIVTPVLTTTLPPFPTFPPVTVAPGTCPAGTVSCCGATLTTNQPGAVFVVPGASPSPNTSYSNYAQYPWNVAIMTLDNAFPPYVAGGVMLDSLHILTAAHKVVAYRANTGAIKVRLGEWDNARTIEPYTFCESLIQPNRIWIHPNFDPINLYNDVAVLRMATAITPGVQPNINNVLLPATQATSFVGQRCWVPGWGKNGFSGTYESLLKHVDVPIVDGVTCNNAMRNIPGQPNRLGPNFNLDTASFICAGGEANKDACTGDGGSGLVCLNTATNRWTLAGLVAWGIGCGAAGVYGTYVNVANFLPWIQSTIAASTP